MDTTMMSTRPCVSLRFGGGSFVSGGAHVAPLEDSLVMTTQQILDFYTHPAEMTSSGGHAPRFDELPPDVAALARVVQGLLLHEHWAPAYGVALSDERRSESHIRPTKRMLDHLLAHDSQPLSVGRPVDARLVGVCRHFTVLLAAMLRAKGVPARARCGFGAYFNRGHFEDHWVCEYWNAAEARWVLVDAQIDELQRAKLHPDFDLLDVPRDRFVIAGDAWAQCRAGEADPSTFGIFAMRGLWFIAGNLMRDVAALNNMEMLPWDVWGAMIRPDKPLQNDQLALFDRLAAVTRAPDTTFAELRALYEGDERLRVRTTVFNSRLNRPETI
jgi:Transglutaminase-like superfamily